MAIVAGLKLSLFTSITKNNFRFVPPRPSPLREAGGSLVNVIVVVFGAVAYFIGRLY